MISTEEFVSVTSDFEAKKIFNLLFLPIVIVAALMFIAAVTAVFIILAMVLKKRNNKVYSQDGYGKRIQCIITSIAIILCFNIYFVKNTISLHTFFLSLLDVFSIFHMCVFYNTELK